MAYKIMYYVRGKRGEIWDRKVYTNKTTALIKLQEAIHRQKSFQKKYPKQGTATLKLVNVSNPTRKRTQGMNFNWNSFR